MFPAVMGSLSLLIILNEAISGASSRPNYPTRNDNHASFISIRPEKCSKFNQKKAGNFCQLFSGFRIKCNSPLPIPLP